MAPNGDDELEDAVEDLQLVPLLDQIHNTRQYKQTLVPMFSTNYSKKFYSTSAKICEKVSNHDNLYKKLHSAFLRRGADSTIAPFNRDTDGLYPLLKRRLDDKARLDEAGLNADSLKPAVMETDDLQDNDLEEDEDDLDLRLVAFENIVRHLPTKIQGEVKRLRHLFNYLDNCVENYQSVLEELVGLRAEYDEYRRQNNHVGALVARVQAMAAKIQRLETFLLSNARNHPHSEALLDGVFEYLGEDDMDLMDRLLRAMIDARPQNIADLASSPSMDVDDTLTGVHQRSGVRTGRGVPSSA